MHQKDTNRHNASATPQDTTKTESETAKPVAGSFLVNSSTCVPWTVTVTECNALNKPLVTGAIKQTQAAEKHALMDL